jgi:hypothetical protein
MQGEVKMRPIVIALVFAFAFALVAAGCAARGLPIEGGSSVSAAVDMARPPPPNDLSVDAEPDGSPGWCINIPCTDHDECARLGCGFCASGSCWVDP